VSARFLLDTNVLAEPLRPAPNAGVLARLERHQGALAIAAPVWHEMVFGLHRLPASRRRERVHDYLYGVVRATLPVLPYDEAAAEWHGRERARLAAGGTPPSFVDGQIAAIARIHGLTVVTRDLTGYAGFEGVRVVSWFR
jgi:tRNA(fMet)-specific endonuclease VapC